MEEEIEAPVANGHVEDEQDDGPFAHLQPESFPDGVPRPSLAEVGGDCNAHYPCSLDE